MGRKHQHMTSIGFKATDSADADLIAWWEALPAGVRSDTLRTLIRAAISAGKPGTANGGYQKPLDRISDDTAWIRSSLVDLPAYLERLMGQMSVSQPPMSDTSRNVPASEADQLSQNAIDRRREKMRQSEW